MSVDRPLVLFVDDEWSSRAVFEQAFGDRFAVKTLASPAAALSLLEQETVAVLVTDQRMPDMTGNALLERARDVSPDTVRVVLTAFSDLDPILQAVNAGLVARYLVKPWDRDELAQILAWAMEAWSLGRESSALQLRVMQTERLVTLGSIAAAVLHDLKRPVAYIASNGERLVDLAAAAPTLRALVDRKPSCLSPADLTLLGDLADELALIAGDVRFGAEQMTALTQGMQRLLRGEPPVAAATDPMPILRYAMSVCQNVARAHRAKIRYEGPTELPRVRIGATELTQVLINLVDNAAQAIAPERGGVVRLSAFDAETSLCLRVVDNGCGMPPELLARVGTLFFSTRAEGTGLGVAQCKRLVERAGGRLLLESEPGVGTLATIHLPKVGAT